MTRSKFNACDDILLYRYLDGDLGADEAEQIKVHLEGCRQCRSQSAAMADFSRDIRDRIQHASDAVDFVAIEKQVLNKVLRQRGARSGLSAFMASLKFIIPSAVTAGLLIFFAYSHYMVPKASVPSAIINSFTGSMSSVMIFETPETRQTILWYTEDIDMESEQNAV
jgi:anti-sigma factor RsiW